MAAETHINDAATFRKAKEIHVNDAGTWRKLKEVHVNDGGVWRKVFNSLAVLVHNTTEGGSEGVYATNGSQDRTVNFVNTGQFAANSGPGTTSYAWLLGGSASDADIFVSVNSGTSPVGSVLGTWLNLGTSRGWTLVWPGGGGSSNCNLAVSIRDAVSLVVLVNAVPIQLNTHP